MDQFHDAASPAAPIEYGFSIRTPLPPPPSHVRRGPGRYDRKQSTVERRSDQRRRVLVAAAKVFAREGYAKTSVAKILDESGVSRGTFYRLFRDLDDVLLSVRRTGAEILYEKVAERVQAEPNAFDKLRVGVTTFLELLGEYGDVARVLHRETQATDPQHEAVHRNAVSRFQEMWKEGLEQAYEAGLISRKPDDLTLYALIVAIEGVGVQYLERGEETRAVEAAPGLVDLCLRAIR